MYFAFAIAKSTDFLDSILVIAAVKTIRNLYDCSSAWEEDLYWKFFINGCRRVVKASSIFGVAEGAFSYRECISMRNRL